MYNKISSFRVEMYNAAGCGSWVVFPISPGVGFVDSAYGFEDHRLFKP